MYINTTERGHLHGWRYLKHLRYEDEMQPDVLLCAKYESVTTRSTKQAGASNTKLEPFRYTHNSKTLKTKPWKSLNEH